MQCISVFFQLKFYFTFQLKCSFNKKVCLHQDEFHDWNKNAVQFLHSICLFRPMRKKTARVLNENAISLHDSRWRL